MTGLNSYRVDGTSHQLKRVHGRIAAGTGKTKSISGPFVCFALLEVEVLPLIALALDAICFLAGHDPAEQVAG